MITGVIAVGSDRVAAAAGTVRYQCHVQDIGWQDWVSNGITAGTSGQSRRLEAIRIKLEGMEGGIEYRTHVQDIGWQDYVSNGALSGTSGQAKRLEAIQIRLTGTAADNFDVYYCVHAENTGWMDWAKNGESSGTAGFGYRLEAIKIQLVAKGAAAPGSVTRPFFDVSSSKPDVSYETHVQDIGWQGYVSNGALSGTTGQGKRLESIQIKLKNTVGGIEYKTHVQDIGWMNWAADGNISGTSGQSKRMEAIQIRLTGAVALQYDVYYRVHAQNFGWLDWAKNGESAGTAGYGYRLEAIEVLVIAKNTAAPGPVKQPFVQSECKIYQLPNHDVEQSMGYVIKTTSGKVVVIDGGSADVTEDLAALIRALGGTVDAWLVTHPHSDHVTAMMNIISKYPDIHVKKIYGSLVSYEKAVEYKDYAAENVLTFNNFIAKHTDIFTSVNTGDMLVFDEIKVEVLMASNPEMTGNFINNQSVVYKVATKEKSALFLGDLGVETSEKLLRVAAGKLDSDIVQAAHHGSYGVTQAVYQAVSPQICMWPCPTWLWNNQPANSAYNSGPWVTLEVRRWMDLLGATNIVAKNGYASIDIAGSRMTIRESASLQKLLLMP